MAEQEAEHNVSYLEPRVCNSLKYHSAVFDLYSVVPSDSGARIKIEEIYACEIRNVIACEGIDRLERHESFGMWKKLMEQEGFSCLGITDGDMLQSQMLLRMYSSEKFKIWQQGPEGRAAASALTLGSMDRLSLPSQRGCHRICQGARRIPETLSFVGFLLVSYRESD